MSLDKLKTIAINIAIDGSPQEKNDAGMVLTEALFKYGNGGVITDPDVSKEHVNSKLGESEVVTNSRKRSSYISGDNNGTARIKQLAFHTQFVTNQDNILPDIMYIYSQIFAVLDPLSGLENTAYAEFYIDRANLIAVADSTNPDYEGTTANPGYLYVSPFPVDYESYMYNAPHGNINL